MSFKDFLENNSPDYIYLGHYKTEDGKPKIITEDDFRELLDFVKSTRHYSLNIETMNHWSEWVNSKFTDAIEAQLLENRKRFECLEEEEQEKIHSANEEKWPFKIAERKESIEDFLNCKNCSKVFDEQDKPIISKCFKHLFCHKKCDPNIDLKKYTKELTEDDFATILEFVKDQYLSFSINFNSKNLRQFIASAFRDQIIYELEKNSRRMQPRSARRLKKNKLGNLVYCIKNHFSEPSYFEKDEFGNEYQVKLNDKPKINRPRIYVPRKGMVWEKKKGYGIEDPEFLELEELREQTKNPKFFIFDLKKIPTRKKIQRNKEKIILGNNSFSILNTDLIKDYYTLKKSKRINFKE